MTPLPAPAYDDPKLPPSQRLKLIGNDLLGALGVAEHSRVRIAREDGMFLITLSDGRIFVPSAWRWKLYKKGYKTRLAQLAAQYGIGRHFTLRPGATVIDIGANIGELPLCLAPLGATVYCFEPDPIVFRCLERNTRELSNVFRLPTAVWKEDGEIELFISPQRADSSVLEPDAVFGRVRVPAITLDSFADERGLDIVDLIKCDAEGVEPEMLEGAASLLRRTRAVALDTGPERHGSTTTDACTAVLRGAGFEVVTDTSSRRTVTIGLNPAAAHSSPGEG